MPGKIVSEKYIDFENDEQNVWCWDDEGVFRKHELENVIAGDTDSGYLVLPDALSEYPLDDVVATCDDMIRSVDADFPDFLKMAFNCPTERLRSVRTEREVVSDKSFFVTKKRYAMHIIDDEGKRVDKTKIMGLEVKKSDTSRSLKTFLRTVIDLVLDGCDREELAKAKKEYKELFMTQSVQEIGVPMPATMLKIYSDRLIQQGDYKGFPYHIRAAMFYNSLCGDLDREIFVGEKFYVCNVKHTESKYIACPVDLNEIPKFVKDIPIDYQVMWKKADKKINNYMLALGWDLKSRREQKAADWFGVKTK